MGKFGSVVIPNAIGLGIIVVGWYISIINVALARFKENILFTKWTLFGLGLIIFGAYLPRLWNKINGWFNR
jgi:hypothetical protein